MRTRTCSPQTSHLIAQAAAIPCRVSQRGGVQVLLITTGSGQWGVPKGTLEDGETAAAAAEREAFEEAGVTGAVLARAVGEFRYRRGGEEHRVEVFAMRVHEVQSHWSERKARRRAWVTLSEARRLVGRPELRRLLRVMDAAMLLEVVLPARGLRTAV